MGKSDFGCNPPIPQWSVEINTLLAISSSTLL